MSRSTVHIEYKIGEVKIISHIHIRSITLINQISNKKNASQTSSLGV